MKEWKHDCGLVIKEEPYLNNLHRLTVYQSKKLIGSVYPINIDHMDWLKEELDRGACPVCDGWDDGRGNLCTLDGWNILPEDPFIESP